MSSTMSWYDFFARFYDASVEGLYVDARAAACAALRLEPGQTVLDLPCGTGQSFDGLVAGVGEHGTVIGVDLSAGMLAKASARVKERGWSRVFLGQSDVHAVDAARLEEICGAPVTVDRLHVFLGMSAFPRWEQAFERLWGLLRPGGRCVILDCYAEHPSFQGRAVEVIAQAQIKRRTWTPLEQVAKDYERTELPSLPKHGGTLVLASGTKPALAKS